MACLAARLFGFVAHTERAVRVLVRDNSGELVPCGSPETVRGITCVSGAVGPWVKGIAHGYDGQSCRRQTSMFCTLCIMEAACGSAEAKARPAMWFQPVTGLTARPRHRNASVLQ